MGQLTLALLGQPALRHDGLPVKLPTRKTMALLAYLATEGGPQARAKLVNLLWPDADEEHGHAVLRTTLRFLRAAIGYRAGEDAAAHLATDRETIAFAFGTDLALDLHLLDDAARLARAPYQTTPVHIIPRLRVAADSYRDEFLEGFSLGDAPDFDDWAAVQREAWQRRAALVLERLTRWLSDSGQGEEARDWGRRWLVIDPLDEAAHRRLIELHLLAGDRAAAARAYQTCRTVLEDAFGLPPSAATDALARRAQASLTSTPMLSVSRGEAGEEVPLVGRTAEFARLTAAHRAVCSGQPYAAVLEGEAGIGKSRLAAVFLGWAAGQGADVLAGKAFELSGGLPYQLVAEALRSRLDVDTARALLPAFWLRHLALVLPEVSTEAGRVDDRTQDKAQACEAVTRLLLALAGRQPVVLFLDDLHWGDEASLDLLRYVARGVCLKRAPLLFLLGARTEELAERPAPRRFLRDLERDLPVHHLALGPLDRAATLQLLSSLPGVPAEQYGERIFQESGGHPLFLVETVRFWREQGVPAEGQRLLAPGVRDAIRDRLAALDVEAAELAAAAAVVGGRLRFETLLAVAGMSEASGLRALDRLVARRILQAAPPCYVFIHDSIRLVAYEETEEARRQILHRRALACLRAASAPAAVLLPHAEATGDTPLVYALRLQAGDDALAVCAGADAAMHYERLIAIGLQPADEVRVWQHLGDAYRLADRLADVVRAYRRMLEAAERAGEARDCCLALNRLATALAQEFTSAAEDPIAVARQALAAAQATGQPELEAESLATLALARFYRGTDLPGSREAASRSLLLARSLDHDALAVSAGSAQAQACLFLGHWTEGSQVAEATATLCRRAGNPPAEANVLCISAGCLMRLGRLEEALDAARRALAISRELGNAWGIATGCFSAGEILLLRGRYDEVDAAAQEGLANARRSGFLPLQSLHHWLLGALQYRLGQMDAAGASFEEALSAAHAIALPVFAEMAWSGRCSVRLLAGDEEGAAACAREALRLRSPVSPFGAYARAADIAALALSGALEPAAADLARLDAQPEQGPLSRLVLLRGRAALAAAQGDIAAAAKALEEAAALAGTHDLPGERYDVLLALAALAPERAAEPLAEARRILDGLDPSGDLARRWAALPEVQALTAPAGPL